MRMKVSKKRNIGEREGWARLQLLGQDLWLHPFGAILLAGQGTILIADPHFGKAAHFRRSGIPVPGAVEDASLDKLMAVLMESRAERVLFLGDLFHSIKNPAWEAFSEVRQIFSGCSFELVPGNHDILPLADYEQAGLQVHEVDLFDPPFYFSHYPQSDPPADRYYFSGHLHPSVLLRGKGRQYMRLPCFWFGKQQAVLPAFGEFTGTSRIYPAPDDRIFALTGEGVILLES